MVAKARDGERATPPPHVRFVRRSRVGNAAPAERLNSNVLIMIGSYGQRACITYIYNIILCCRNIYS